MTMREFIKSNRTEIDAKINALDAAIHGILYRHDGRGGPGRVPPPRRNDRERADWVSNNDGLYQWARHAGVRF